MMKSIKYQFETTVNHGTEDEPDIVKSFTDKAFFCSDETFDSNYNLALSEAYNGEVTVEEVEDEETPSITNGEASIWTELNRAYQEGVDSV